MNNNINFINKIKLKKGDEVIVLAGKNKGKTGKILLIFPKTNKVKVAGINQSKRHTKPNPNKTPITNILNIFISPIIKPTPK